MTAPVPMQPPQPPMLPQPTPPPSPFVDRVNESEPRVATVILKMTGKLMFDPRFAELKAKSPGWAALVEQKYQAAAQALQPPPVLPKGVSIQEKVDPSNVGEAEQNAIAGMRPPPQNHGDASPNTAQTPQGVNQPRTPSPHVSPKLPGPNG